MCISQSFIYISLLYVCVFGLTNKVLYSSLGEGKGSLNIKRYLADCNNDIIR